MTEPQLGVGIDAFIGPDSIPCCLGSAPTEFSPDLSPDCTDNPVALTEVASAFVDQLQGTGTYTFSRADVRDALSTSEIAVGNALRRLKKRGRIVTPRRGFYVIVPTEYRMAGSPPPSWFIDDLMGFLGKSHYGGLLSAAAIHGASNQQPMTFQVVTDRPTREGVAGRARITFHMSRQVAETPATQVQTETGTMLVSTPESTAFDLVRFPAACGGWSNIATVLLQLAERLEPDALCSVTQLPAQDLRDPAPRLPAGQSRTAPDRRSVAPCPWP